MSTIILTTFLVTVINTCSSMASETFLITIQKLCLYYPPHIAKIPQNYIYKRLKFVKRLLVSSGIITSDFYETKHFWTVVILVKWRKIFGFHWKLSQTIYELIYLKHASHNNFTYFKIHKWFQLLFNLNTVNLSSCVHYWNRSQWNLLHWFKNQLDLCSILASK